MAKEIYINLDESKTIDEELMNSLKEVFKSRDLHRINTAVNMLDISSLELQSEEDNKLIKGSDLTTDFLVSIQINNERFLFKEAEVDTEYFAKGKYYYCVRVPLIGVIIPNPEIKEENMYIENKKAFPSLFSDVKG